MCFRVINNGKNQCLFTTLKLGRRSKLGSSTVPIYSSREKIPGCTYLIVDAYYFLKANPPWTFTPSWMFLSWYFLYYTVTSLTLFFKSCFLIFHFVYIWGKWSVFCLHLREVISFLFTFERSGRLFHAY